MFYYTTQCLSVVFGACNCFFFFNFNPDDYRYSANNCFNNNDGNDDNDDDGFDNYNIVKKFTAFFFSFLFLLFKQITIYSTVKLLLFLVLYFSYKYNRMVFRSIKKTKTCNIVVCYCCCLCCCCRWVILFLVRGN